MSRRSITSLALRLTASVAAAAAADDAAAPYALPTVLVSASRLPGELSAATRDVLVVDAAAIEASAPASIADLLASLPGVDDRSRGPGGVQADLEIDGSTFSQVLLLVDGMRVSDPQTAHHLLNLPLAPADLERVEVLYGAGSSVHGPDALGGVVNLVPRAQAGARVDVAARWGESLDAGSAGVATDAGLRWGWGGGWGSASAAVGKRRSDGYREGTDFDEEQAFLHARLPVAGGLLSLQCGVQDKAFGARDFYAPYPSREWTTAQLAGATYRSEQLTLRAYGRRHRDRFVLVAADPALYENRHESLLAGAEGSAVAAVAGGRLVVGGELSRQSVDSSNLGEHARVGAGLFGEYGAAFGPWRLTAGARADRHGGFGWQVSPAVSAARSLGRGRLFASVARAYRAPSFTELYYTDPNNLGDPDLGAERSWQAEVGGGTPIAGAQVAAALFARREDRLIDYVRPAGQPPWQARNLGALETVGLRLRARRAWRHAAVEAGYTRVDKERALEAGMESKYVFTHPRHQVSASLRHDLPLGAAALWQLAARQRLAPLDDYRVIDLALSRPLGWGRALVRVRNLTDERYEAVLGVPLPGRWFGVETRVDL